MTLSKLQKGCFYMKFGVSYFKNCVSKDNLSPKPD